MKRLIASIWLALGTAAVLSACSASAGKEYDRGKVASYQPGVTTCGQIKSDLGEPLETVREGDGSTKISYGKATSTIRGETFIPIVGLFAGGADTTYDFVEIKCDPQGVFVEYQSKIGTVSSQ